MDDPTALDPDPSGIDSPGGPSPLVPAAADDTAMIQALLQQAADEYRITGQMTDAVLPAGDYIVSRSTRYGCLSIPSGVRFCGPGRIKLAAAQPAQTRILVLKDVENVIVDELTIDGNSAEQAAETDPKSHGVFVVGSSNVVLRNMTGRNIDGDMFYFGKSDNDDNDDPYARQCVAEGFWVDGTRRSLVTITSGASEITIRNGYGVNWSGDQSAALNIESDTAPSHNCVFDGVYVDAPRQEQPHTSFAVSVSQGHGTRIVNCRFPATVVVTNSDGARIEGNIIEHPGTKSAGGSGIQVRRECRNLRVSRNTISVDGPPSDPPALFHTGCIHVLHTNDHTPMDVLIEDNHLLPGAGLTAVWCTSLAGITTITGNIVHGGGAGRGVVIQLDSSELPFPDVRIDGNTIMNLDSQQAGIRIVNESRNTPYGKIAITGNRFTQARPTECAIRFQPSNVLGGRGFGDVRIEGNVRTPSISTEVRGR